MKQISILMQYTSILAKSMLVLLLSLTAAIAFPAEQFPNSEIIPSHAALEVAASAFSAQQEPEQSRHLPSEEKADGKCLQREFSDFSVVVTRNRAQPSHDYGLDFFADIAEVNEDGAEIGDGLGILSLSVEDRERAEASRSRSKASGIPKWRITPQGPPQEQFPAEQEADQLSPIPDDDEECGEVVGNSIKR